MSRSYKKTPAGGMKNTSRQKAFRSKENRAKRHRVKQLLHADIEADMPSEKMYGNEWASPRDGKQYWRKPRQEARVDSYLGITTSRDWLKEWKKRMRK